MTSDRWVVGAVFLTVLGGIGLAATYVIEVPLPLVAAA